MRNDEHAPPLDTVHRALQLIKALSAGKSLAVMVTRFVSVGGMLVMRASLSVGRSRPERKPARLKLLEGHELAELLDKKRSVDDA